MTGKLRIQHYVAIVVTAIAVAVSGPVYAEEAGDTKWEFCVGIEEMASFSYSVSMADDGTLYAGRLNGKLYAIWPNGTQRWEFDAVTPISSVAAIADDGTVYVSSGHRLHALTPYGSEKWSVHAPCLFLGDPAIAKDGTVYIGSNSSKLFAITPEGAVKWTFSVPRAMGVADPVIGRNGTVYFGTLGAGEVREHWFCAVNPNGTLKWKYTYDSPNGMTGSPAIANNNLIYVGVATTNLKGFILLALRADDGYLQTICQDLLDIDGNHRTSACIGEDGKVYMPSGSCHFCVYRPDGILLWRRYPFHAGLTAPAIASDGKFYFCEQYTNSQIHAYRPKAEELWEEHWKKGTEGQSLSSPLITDHGVMYVGCYHSVKAIYIDSPGPANSAWPMHRANRKRNGRVDKFFISLQTTKFLLIDPIYCEIKDKQRMRLDTMLQEAVAALQDEQPVLAFELLGAFSREIETLGRAVPDRAANYLLLCVDEILEQIVDTLMEEEEKADRVMPDVELRDDATLFEDGPIFERVVADESRDLRR